MPEMKEAAYLHSGIDKKIMERAYNMKIFIKLLLVLSMLFSLSSCSGDPNVIRIKDDTAQTTLQLNNLIKALHNGSINNATILKVYASKLKAQKPEYTELTKQFSKMASPNNPTINDFKQRLKLIRENPNSLGNQKSVITELTALLSGTKKEMYGDSLLDVINTIADLSDGTLSRLHTPARTKDELAASQLVGNPQYGHWQEDSGGQSFWAWYGQYALISSLLGGHRYGYNNWSYNRGWSHYNDYGRDRYSSSSQRNRHDSIQKKNAPNLKQYGKNTGRTQSSYSGRRSNPKYASTLNTRAITAAKAARYKSSYSGSNSSNSHNSSSSRYSSSARSNSYSSRSRFGGK
ncbi:MAG: hypothetical protein Q9M11_07170 [Mariprofundaceae bacterium]|nr:hypothetical protein [Mariprofundaceae bacterium]